MKLSMMTYTVARQPEHFDLTKMLDLTVELEMAGVDFVTLHGEKAATLRSMCDERGLPVVCHTFMAGGLASADAKERAAALDDCRKSFEAANILGAPITMIPTPGAADIDRDQGRANWIAGLKEAEKLASEAGIILTVENFPGDKSPFVTADDIQKAMSEIPTLKVTYDSGNASTGEEPAESFRLIAKETVHAHFKDWDIAEGESEGFRHDLDGRWRRPALIGEGVLDHKAILQAMKAEGYDGCINIEYEGNKHDPYEGIRRATDYLKGIATDIGY